MARHQEGFLRSCPPAAVLLALALVCACAEGPKSKSQLKTADATAFAAIGQVRVVANNANVRAEAARRVAHGNGPALAPADARGVPELHLRVACEATFDQWRPEPPINAPDSGVDSDKMSNWHPISDGALPACEGDAEVMVGGKSVWVYSARLEVLSGESARALTDILVDGFITAWRKIRSVDGPGTKPATPAGG